jgi:hypothetical protein
MVPGRGDQEVAVMVTMSVLVSGLDAELRRLGYKDSTLIWYRGCWRRMERFFAARGVDEFSLDIAMVWVNEACGFFEKESSGTLEANDVYLFRVAQMLGDYAIHGSVLRRYSRSIDKLSGEAADTVARFQAWLRVADRAVSTVRTYGTVAGEFVAFVDARGGLARCDAATIDAFVATLVGYQAKTVEQKLCALRSFLVFASVEGRLDADQGGPSAIGVGARPGGIDSRRDRSGQPMREAGLRDRAFDRQARTTRRRRQALGVRGFRLAGQPVTPHASQDR